MRYKKMNIEYKNGFMMAKCSKCGEYQMVKTTDDQFKRLSEGHEHVQNIFPELSPDQREIYISGICGSCWDRMFGEG